MDNNARNMEAACREVHLRFEDLTLHQNANDIVQIKASELPNAGRGLFVTKDIDAWEELFRDEPLVTIVKEGKKRRVCDWCHCVANQKHYSHADGSPVAKEDIPVIELCHGCKTIGYCSTECYEAAFASYHKQECMVLQPLRDVLRVGTRTNWMIVCRILCMHSMGTLLQSKLSDLLDLKTDDQDSYDSPTHQGEHGQGLSGQKMALFLQNLMKSSLSVEIILKIFQVVGQNTVVSNEDGTTNARQSSLNVVSLIAAGHTYICSSIDLKFSRINHSCKPNAHYFMEGRTIRVRSIEPLKQGGEVTVTYVPNEPGMKGLHNRRSELLDHYGFFCNCPRCLHDELPVVASLKTPNAEEENRNQDELVDLVKSTNRAPSNSELQLDHEMTCMAENIPEISTPVETTLSHPSQISEDHRRLPAKFKDALRSAFQRPDKYFRARLPVPLVEVMEMFRGVIDAIENFMVKTNELEEVNETSFPALNNFHIILKQFSVFHHTTAAMYYGNDVRYVARCKWRVESLRKAQGRKDAQHAGDLKSNETWEKQLYLLLEIAS